MRKVTVNYPIEMEDIIDLDSGREVEVETEPITQYTMIPSNFSM